MRSWPRETLRAGSMQLMAIPVQAFAGSPETNRRNAEHEEMKRADAHKEVDASKGMQGILRNSG